MKASWVIGVLALLGIYIIGLKEGSGSSDDGVHVLVTTIVMLLAQLLWRVFCESVLLLFLIKDSVEENTRELVLTRKAIERGPANG